MNGTRLAARGRGGGAARGKFAFSARGGRKVEAERRERPSCLAPFGPSPRSRRAALRLCLEKSQRFTRRQYREYRRTDPKKKINIYILFISKSYNILYFRSVGMDFCSEVNTEFTTPSSNRPQLGGAQPS